MKKLYKFTSTTCGVCRMIQPLWDKLVSKVGDKAECSEIVLDGSEQAGKFIVKYKVNSVPRIILESDEEILFDKVGAISMADLSFIKNLIES